VSVIATGMGTPNTDFVMRETRAIVDGEMAFIRVGTCGGLNTANPGTIVVADSSHMVYRDPGAVHAPIPAGDEGKVGGLEGPTPAQPYALTISLPADAELSDAVSGPLFEPPPSSPFTSPPAAPIPNLFSTPVCC
jgi:hypothetical protein